MGPTALFDKSFLQSLTVDESVLFDHFFTPVICPLFYVETLADLEKAVRQGRSPEQEVRIIAQKTPEMHGTPCVHNTDLCISDLMRRSVPMNGQIPVAGGKPVRVEGRSGVVFEETPEAEAFRRWQAGEFLEVERRFAKEWRKALNSVDLMTVAAGMRALGVNPQTCKSLEQAKALADDFVRRKDGSPDRMKFALLTLGLPREWERIIAEQWNNCGSPPLGQYAPFAAHVLTVELFFQIALGAGLIGTADVANRTDVAYLWYLPLCMVLVSSDKLHQRIAPHFLRADQSFVWGLDLKADLGRLVERYQAMPPEEQEKGLMKFALFPPQDGECLVTKIWNHHSDLMRQREAGRLKRVFEESAPSQENVEAGARRLRPLPTSEQELLTHLRRFRDAPELSPDEVDFDTANPDLLSIQRKVRKRKGSIWQLPKDLKE
jgi:hypothetical protein